ncbi:hypothetical protein AB0B10_24970 [Micromonospora arborensis]|uniref:hypothetical protein n=1 Tax=Micromonospora arborensis TaxID=2116518 RepID=UPI00341128DC
MSVEVLLDPPGHVRLASNDDEIVDRVVAVQALAGRPVRLVTYDTKMAMRARHVGLRVHRLEQPEGEEKQPQQRRGRDAKGGDRFAEVKRIRDPAVRAVRVGELINARQDSIGYLSGIRREALEDLVGDGLNRSQIADRTGLTRQQVGQFLAEPSADATPPAEDLAASE